MTHARLRAAQGDQPGAAAILRRILAREPSDPQALALLATLGGEDASSGEAARESPLPPPRPGSAAELRDTFQRQLGLDAPHARVRARRLAAWLERLQRRA